MTTVLAALLLVALVVIAVLVRARARLASAVAAVERAAERVEAERLTSDDRGNRLERALDAIPQGVVLYDETGAPTHRNIAAATLLDVGPSDALVEDAIGQSVQRALDGDVDTRVVDLFGPPRRTLDLRSVPLVDSGWPGALVVIEDVSERRRLENVRRDFVANISHELKTPVGALSLLAETLLAEDDPQVARRLGSRLLDEAFRVSRTIDDLLELSRIEAGEATPAEDVPAHLIVAEAVARVAPAAEQRGIAIEVDEPHQRVALVGDRRQIVSAVYNLLDNAVKYSDPGSSVQVRARSNGTWVEINVQDHGIGIPRRDVERVFERFYRVDPARSRETGGTGLGLAIVRHVASNHRGEVQVESQEGVGSTFTLRLPAGAGPVAIDAEAG